MGAISNTKFFRQFCLKYGRIKGILTSIKYKGILYNRVAEPESIFKFLVESEAFYTSDSATLLYIEVYYYTLCL